MNWKKTGPYSWKREDGNAVISATRHSGSVQYASWKRCDDAKWHPKGWLCVAVSDTAAEARQALSDDVTR